MARSAVHLQPFSSTLSPNPFRYIKEIEAIGLYLQKIKGGWEGSLRGGRGPVALRPSLQETFATFSN
jgi:hypothetical protein